MQTTGSWHRVAALSVIVMMAAPGCDGGAGGERQPVPQGPDQQPLPGAPGGAAIPSPRGLRPTPSGGDMPSGDRAKSDMDANPGQPTGTVGGTTWRRLDGDAWEFDVPGPPPRTYRVNPLTGEVDDITLTNADQVFAGLGRTYFGKTGNFRARVANCTDAIWVQYIKVEYKFYNAAGTEVAAHTSGPQIDGQIPYQYQESAGGSAHMHDDPGAQALGGSTAQQVAPAAINAYKAEAGVTDATITKLVKKYDFWSYLICLAPTYRVVGHIEWGFTQTVDVNTAPYISKSDERGPTWVPGS